MTRKNIFAIIAMLLTMIGIQLLCHWSGKAFYLTQLTMSAYYALVIVGLCLVMGYAGQISLGHAGFFGIGGYVSAALTTHNFAQYTDSALVIFLKKCGFLVAGQDLYGGNLLTFPPWSAFIIAVWLTIVIAFAIGIPVLKLKGHYLAMATLGFGTIIYRVALASSFFGEADGISSVPGFELLPGLEVSGSFSSRVPNYYIACGILVIGVVLLLNLINSRVGRALRAIHGSGEAAEAMG
nr:branched-chain amino acid ABC transporter permease [Desulfobulbaceae bacterium]